MNLRHLENAIAHTVAQMIGRNVPAPYPDVEGTVSADSWQQYSTGYLVEAILERVHGHFNTPLWARLVYQKMNGRFVEVIEAFQTHLAFINEHNAAYILISDERYPPLLRSIKSPPLALCAKGDLRLLAQPKIAMIGSRKAATYALYETEKLATWLADRGIVIVSGSAYGCDLAAHQGALNSAKSPIPAVVVCPGGLARLEPTCNRETFEQLEQGAAIFLSERLWWARPIARDYVARNRIISGLCLHIVVMQADLGSGTMNTANLALEQGRDVFVLAHHEDDINAMGSLKLIDEGARSFINAEDFFTRCLSVS